MNCPKCGTECVYDDGDPDVGVLGAWCCINCDWFQGCEEIPPVRAEGNEIPND